MACRNAFKIRSSIAILPCAVFLVSPLEVELNRPNYAGLMAHELAHLIGMEHEFNRPDRDQHIVFNKDILRAGEAHRCDIFKTHFWMMGKNQDEQAEIRNCGRGTPHWNASEKIATKAMGSFDVESITMYGPYIFKLADEGKQHIPFMTRKSTNRADFYAASTLSRKDMRSIAYLYQSMGAPLIAPDRIDGLPDVQVERSRSTNNQEHEVQFEVNTHVPDCSYVKVRSRTGLWEARVVQRPGSTNPKQCSFYFAGSENTYFNVQLLAHKEKAQSCYDSVRLDRRGRQVTQKVCNNIPSGPFSVEQFRITIGNPNNAPQSISASLENSNRQIPFIRGTVKERLIAKLTTTDLDLDDKHSYSIIRAGNNQDHLSFVVVGNELWSAKTLTNDKYSITVQATDLKGN